MAKSLAPIKTRIAWILKSQKTTITGCAVLLGTGIKWSMGAVSPADVPEVLELVEEALDQISVAIEPWAEDRHVDPVWHGLDVGPGAPVGHLLAQAIAIVAAVGE